MTDRELTDNTQLLFDYMQRVEELKARIVLLEVIAQAARTLMKADWDFAPGHDAHDAHINLHLALAKLEDE